MLPGSVRCPECAELVWRSLRFGGLRFTPAVERAVARASELPAVRQMSAAFSQDKAENTKLLLESENHRRMVRPTIWQLLKPLLAALFTPARFYRGLRVRSDPAPADRVAIYTMVGIYSVGILAFLAVAVGSVIYYEGTGWLRSVILGATTAMVWHFLICAAFQRFAIGTHLLLRAGPAGLPDCAWARRILAYERVFLAVFTAFLPVFTAVLFTSYDLLSELTDWLWPGGLFGTDLFTVALGFVHLIWCLLVFWRAEIALRNIRYANA